MTVDVFNLVMQTQVRTRLRIQEERQRAKVETESPVQEVALTKVMWWGVRLCRETLAESMKDKRAIRNIRIDFRLLNDLKIGTKKAMLPSKCTKVHHYPDDGLPQRATG